MKFFIVFACLIAAASAVPALLAPAAATYHTQRQSLIPVGQTVHSTVVSQPIITKTYAAPLVAGPLALGHGAIVGAPLAAPLAYGSAGLAYGSAGLALGHGLYGAPLAAAPLAYGVAGLGYGRGVYGAPLAAAPLGLGYGHGLGLGLAKSIY